MIQEYTITESNTGYKVWGILVIIFGILTGVSVLMMLLYVDSKSYESYEGLYILTVLMSGLIMVLVKIKTGVLLVQKHTRTKSLFSLYESIYFLSATLWFVYIIAINLVGVKWIIFNNPFEITICIIKMVWDMVTGFLLYTKRKKLVPVNPISNTNGSENKVAKSVSDYFSSK